MGLIVMAGAWSGQARPHGPAIHVFPSCGGKDVDGGDKRRHDEDMVNAHERRMVIAKSRAMME
jgi:hypothetical protein